MAELTEESKNLLETMVNDLITDMQTPVGIVGLWVETTDGKTYDLNITAELEEL